MRFLFVYQNFAAEMRELLAELKVTDVVVIPARKGSDGPTHDELALLRKHPGAPAAACEINRGYRKNIENLVDLCCEPKKFRPKDLVLREWLAPAAAVQPPAVQSPVAAFAHAKRTAPALVIHDRALQDADRIDEIRWPFVSRAALLLAKVANGEDVGAPKDWKAKHAVEAARNGDVLYEYRATLASETAQSKSDWHLKEGDRTTREAAARIYFDFIHFKNQMKVAVFYVGPHPERGREIDLNCD